MVHILKLEVVKVGKNPEKTQCVFLLRASKIDKYTVAKSDDRMHLEEGEYIECDGKSWTSTKTSTKLNLSSALSFSVKEEAEAEFARLTGK